MSSTHKTQFGRSAYIKGLFIQLPQSPCAEALMRQLPGLLSPCISPPRHKRPVQPVRKLTAPPG